MSHMFQDMGGKTLKEADAFCGASTNAPPTPAPTPAPASAPPAPQHDRKLGLVWTVIAVLLAITLLVLAYFVFVRRRDTSRVGSQMGIRRPQTAQPLRPQTALPGIFGKNPFL